VRDRYYMGNGSLFGKSCLAFVTPGHPPSRRPPLAICIRNPVLLPRLSPVLSSGPEIPTRVRVNRVKETTATVPLPVIPFPVHHHSRLACIKPTHSHRLFPVHSPLATSVSACRLSILWLRHVIPGRDPRRLPNFTLYFVPLVADKNTLISI